MSLVRYFLNQWFEKSWSLCIPFLIRSSWTTRPCEVELWNTLTVLKKKKKDTELSLQSPEKAQRFGNWWKLDLVRTKNISVNSWRTTLLVSLFFYSDFWHFTEPSEIQTVWKDRKENKAGVKAYNYFIPREFVWGSIQITPPNKARSFVLQFWVGQVETFSSWCEGKEIWHGRVRFSEITWNSGRSRNWRSAMHSSFQRSMLTQIPKS